jgi:hypothetical protein
MSRARAVGEEGERLARAEHAHPQRSVRVDGAQFEATQRPEEKSLVRRIDGR